MKELATLAVAAEPFLEKLPTLLGLVVDGHVRFLPEFVGPVGKRALLAERTLAEFPVATELCFKFDFEVWFSSCFSREFGC